MVITEENVEKTEQELLKTSAPVVNLYDPAYFNILKELLLTDNDGNTGIFKEFIYKNSLRFSVLFRQNPCLEMINWIVDEIKKYIKNNKKDTILLWYSQINGFSDILLEKLNYTDPYRYYLFRIERDDIDTNVDMKGLTKSRCTGDMIDLCIDIMEDLFTPFPDSSGSFRNDKERITKDFLCDDGGVTLFFKDNELIGFCGHKGGHFTEVCVRKEYQGKGYGEVIVRSVLKSVYESGYNAELTTGNYNERAIMLYQKAGFKKVYESIRVYL